VNARRRFGVALALSIAAHVLLFTFTRPVVEQHRLSSSAGPMIVTLVEQPAAVPAAPPPPAPRPAPRPPAPPPARRMLTARPKTPRAAPPIPVPEARPPEPRPAPPTPTPAPPAPDMLAMLNARRAERRAAQAAAAAPEGTPNPAPVEDKGAAALERNLESLRGDDRTGGIFQILEKGSYTAEYAFNGWRPDTQRRWREVIEVRVKPGDDIDRAIVRSMIALIRTHYSGDFQWESQRLGRVVTLSARPGDNEYLEEFLIREFFGTPLINRPAAQR
jgi:hypothetical protein